MLSSLTYLSSLVLFKVRACPSPTGFLSPIAPDVQKLKLGRFELKKSKIIHYNIVDRLLAVIYLFQTFTEERNGMLNCYFGVRTEEDVICVTCSTCGSDEK
jgi:hypothetical protein